MKGYKQLKLNIESISGEKDSWESAGIKLPDYDIEKIRKKLIGILIKTNYLLGYVMKLVKLVQAHLDMNAYLAKTENIYI